MSTRGDKGLITHTDPVHLARLAEAIVRFEPWYELRIVWVRSINGWTLICFNDFSTHSEGFEMFRRLQCFVEGYLSRRVKKPRKAKS